jgi:soluble cytochrome b562
MSNDQEGFEESLKAVHQAEEAVYHAQANAGDRQQAFQQLLIAKDKVHTAQKLIEEGNVEAQHRLHQAVEHLRHLEEAQQSLED